MVLPKKFRVNHTKNMLFTCRKGVIHREVFKAGEALIEMNRESSRRAADTRFFALRRGMLQEVLIRRGVSHCMKLCLYILALGVIDE